MADLNKYTSNKIENLEIIKPESGSATLYGSRAVYGAIVVKTK